MGLYSSPYGYYFDYSYIFILVALLITTAASMYLNSIYAKYSRVSARASYTPADVAKIILRENGINVRAGVEIAGFSIIIYLQKMFLISQTQLGCHIQSLPMVLQRMK